MEVYINKKLYLGGLVELALDHLLALLALLNLKSRARSPTGLSFTRIIHQDFFRETSKKYLTDIVLCSVNFFFLLYEPSPDNKKELAKSIQPFARDAMTKGNRDSFYIRDM